MFDRIKVQMLAKGETVLGDDPSLVDHYAQLINERLSAMNDAWCDAQEAAEGDDQAAKLDALSKEIAKVLCSVAAFGYSFGFPMEEVVERVIREGDALRSPMFADGVVR
ncbi:hypothetical protein CGK74_11915 [Thauera propionica]|uniref:NTP pyrophosphohydrolase MazG putative catalytic core domain-containing protein n=1 Tax=Thauera propionica TaxID=2019431 RepID=A0A235EX77_9RHOO|nr:hypothetical protein [Thauera propionica]OYD53648.1 hypothetical protein CGK74_11915 [Thauera propionica]